MVRPTQEGRVLPLTTTQSTSGVSAGGDDIDWDSSSSTAAIIVEESDGYPSVAGVDTLIFDSAGFQVTDNADGSVLVENLGGTGALPWFDVTDYGAVGDGVTDDRTAVNLAIAAYNAAGGGVLYFPAVAAGDYYYVSDALTGLTAPGTVLGDGGGSTDGAASPIATDHATATLFTESVDNLHWSGLRLVNFGGAESAGSAIATTTGKGKHCRYDDLWVEGFYDGLSLLHGAEWAMTRCHVTNPVRYGLRIANTDLPDGGDWAISDTWFGTRTRNATAAIRQESAGGGKLVNVKVNANPVADQGGGIKKYVTGIHAYIDGATNNTSVLTLASVSIENVSGDAILIQTNGTGTFGMVSFAGLEVALYSNNTGRAVKISAASTGGFGTAGGIGVVVIDGMTARTDGTARAAVELVNSDRVTLGDFALSGFNARYTSSGDTNTTDGGASSLTIEDEGTPLATSATTLDFVGAGVVASGTGAEKTITIPGTPTGAAGGDLSGTYPNPSVVDDSHSHTAATAPSSGGPLLVSDDHSTPILFADLLLTEDGDDLLYADSW